MNEALDMTRRPTLQHLATLFAALCAAWVPHAAQAQSSACEQLRSSLAARLDPAIRGYSMEVVPAKTPVPRGAKVIGNCEGGAKKVLFWRFGGSLPKASAASEVAAAPVAPAPTPAPAPKKIEAAPVRPAPAPPPPPPVQPPPAPPLTVQVAPVVAEPVVVARAAEPPLEPTPASSAAPFTVAEPASANEPAAPPTAEAPPLAGHWAWWLALLPLVGGLWVWWARRSAYDASGLPRGPRLN